MPAFRLALPILVAAGLGACATSAPVTSPSETAELRPGAAYGDFLNGHAALNQGRRGEAARYLARASSSVPGDRDVRRRAFIAALLAGDVPRAAELAPSEPGADQRLGALVRGVEALAQKRGEAAAEALSADVIGYPHRTAVLLVRPFALAAAGDLTGAAAPVESAKDRLLPIFGELGRAQLLERAGRFDEAEASLKGLSDRAPDNDLFLTAYAEFLERRSRRPEAAELYRRALADEPSHRELTAALARATTRRAAAPPLATPQQGAAQALTAVAANLTAESQQDLALAYLRLALRLDPQRDDAWLLVGDLLNDGETRAEARAAYARIRPQDADYPAAQARIAWSWQAEENTAQALAVIDAAAQVAPKDDTLRLTRAEVLRSADRHDEAVQVLTAAMQDRSEPDWRLHYLRGTALERSGRWAEAEADLIKALELRPDDPEILNYLGYAWVDRGERIDQAFGMIEKAVSLRPDSGAIVDSLGWAHYRRGHFDQALTLLERAVELEPADPEINDHLGDLYWRLGRRTEAQFQWRRVLTLDPEPKIKARAEAKLASGLDGTTLTTAGKP